MQSLKAQSPLFVLPTSMYNRPIANVNLGYIQDDDMFDASVACSPIAGQICRDVEHIRESGTSKFFELTVL